MKKVQKIKAGAILAVIGSKISDRSPIWGDALPLTAARSAWVDRAGRYAPPIQVAELKARAAVDIELVFSGGYLAAGDMEKNGVFLVARGAAWRSDSELVGLWLGQLGDRHAAAWLRRWLFSLGVKRPHGEMSELELVVGGVAFETLKNEVESIFRNAFLQSFSALAPYVPFLALRLRMGSGMRFDSLPSDMAGAGEIMIAARKLGGKLATSCRDASKADLFRLSSGVDLSGVAARAEVRMIPLSEKNLADRARAGALRKKCSAIIAAAASHCASVQGWSAARRAEQFTADKDFILSAWRWSVGRHDGNRLLDLSSDSVRHFALRLRARISCGVAALPPGKLKIAAAAAAADWFSRSGASVRSSSLAGLVDDLNDFENQIEKRISPSAAAALAASPAIHRLRRAVDPVAPALRAPRVFPAPLGVSPGATHGFARDFSTCAQVDCCRWQNL